MLLTRVVRLALVPGRGSAPAVRAWSAIDGWCAALEIEVCVTGTPDTRTGYIVGIQEVDRAAKEAAERIIPESFMRGGSIERVLEPLRTELVSRLRLSVKSVAIRPHAHCTLRCEEDMPDSVVVTQRFEFAASHRLHCAGLPDEENRRIFGKCNNPAGHGHNYRLEVEVRVPLADAPTLRATDVERIARECVVDRLDHRHLNSDVEAFRARNPSVEAIAATCFEWLEAPMASAGGTLLRVRLWETEKTSAIYPG
jgi:6-pyruvoyltetrahydropterin/6-carboxytetrahydropterin synthase